MANSAFTSSMNRMVPTAPVVSGGEKSVSKTPEKFRDATGASGPLDGPWGAPASGTPAGASALSLALAWSYSA